MEITTDELLAEAGRMALELRLKDREIVRLAAENTALRAKLGADPDPAGSDGPA